MALGADVGDAPSSVHTFQDDLFSGARWIVRTTSSGTIVRVKVVPAGHGLVTIETFERRRPDERDFRRRPEEEGRTVPLTSLAPDHEYHALFGTSTVR